MNTENIYGQQQQQQQHPQYNTMMQATLNGNSFPQDQISAGVASMTINNAPPMKFSPQSLPQQYPNQSFPPPPPSNQQQQNQKITSSFNGLNAINNNTNDNSLKSPNLSQPPPTSIGNNSVSNALFQGQSKSIMPPYSTNNLVGDAPAMMPTIHSQQQPQAPISLQPHTSLHPQQKSQPSVNPLQQSSIMHSQQQPPSLTQQPAQSQIQPPMSNSYMQQQRPFYNQSPDLNKQQAANTQNVNYMSPAMMNHQPPPLLNQNSNFPPQPNSMMDKKSAGLPPPPSTHQNMPPPSIAPPLTQPYQQQQPQEYMNNQVNQQRPMLPPQQQRYSNVPGGVVQQPHMPGGVVQQPHMSGGVVQQPHMSGGVVQQQHMPPPMHQPSPYQSQQSMMPPPPPGPGAPGFHGERNYNQPPGMYNDPYHQPPAAQRRLDPDQMPNPIQVITENQQQCGGIFVTNQAGLLPPLVTTKYVTQDQGNSSPRFVRSSLYNVPATADILKQTGLSLSLIISPFAKIVEGEIEPPIVNFGELGPIRCIRCKAYMSPNMMFIDAGRRFQCLLCKATTEVRNEYFQHLDHTGQRVDKYERPELVLGTYEFVATKDYCRENTPPNPPAFIFVIDVSYNNIKSGLVHLLCRHIKQIISNLPIDREQDKTKMKVGFITYNNVVHFYNIKSSLAQPQMMVVGDTQEMFMPLLDGFLCDPEESSAVIDALMEQIPLMFNDTKETETILLPAIQAGLEALKASNCPGKLYVFNSSLPIAEAPGKLRNRDDRKLLGTEKEKTVLTPQTTSYNQLGQDCVQVGCSVDLFIFNNSYIDIATIGQVSRLTGGEVYKYTYFQADIDGERLIKDICMNVSKPIGFDGVMRIRTSTGVRPTDFYGHYFMSNTTDLELASIDCNKAVAIEIKHDDKLSPEENVYIQIALLYTSCSGQRRLRIMNLALKVTTQISEVFRSCDLDATILFFAKQSMFKLMELTPKVVKDNLIHRSAQILACYRKNCTSPTSAGQLILPECLKLLPLYISCMIKNDALSGGSDMTCDDRSFVIQFVLAMNLPQSVFYFYPRLIPIHNIDLNDNEENNSVDNIPLPIRCTHEKMFENGAYLLENGIHMFLWIGLNVSPEFLKSLFGVQSIQQVNTERFNLSLVPDSPLSIKIKQITETIKMQRSKCMKITLVRQHDKLENVFKHFLVEDRGTDGSASYVDFLCHMHKEIKELLS